MACFHFHSFAKGRVCFVEEKDRTRSLRSFENPGEILLRFANVFAHYLAQIDPVEVEVQLIGEHFGCHSLARTAGTGKERTDPQAANASLRKAPLLMHGVAVTNMDSHFAE